MKRARRLTSPPTSTGRRSARRRRDLRGARGQLRWHERPAPRARPDHRARHRQMNAAIVAPVSLVASVAFPQVSWRAWAAYRARRPAPRPV